MKRYTYAIPDTHGRFDLLAEAYLSIGTHAVRHEALVSKTVLLGDYVDRGPNSRGIIEFLMQSQKNSDRGALIALKGNHEQMLIDLVEEKNKIKGLNVEIADNDEVAPTLKSYGLDPANPDFSQFPQSHLAFMKGLPFYFVDEHRVFVHAWLDPDKHLPDQDPDDMIWNYFLHGIGDDGFKGLHIVHGHESFPLGPVLNKGRTNLDTLAWFSGRLSVGVFDDAIPGGPIEIMEIKGRTMREINRPDTAWDEAIRINRDIHEA